MKDKVNTWLALKYHIIAWNIFGLLPPPSNPIKCILYMILIFFVNFIGVGALLLAFGVKYYKDDNATEQLGYHYPEVIGVLIVLKLVNSFSRRHQLLNMRSMFEKLDNRATTLEEIQVLEKTIKAAQNFFILFARNFCGSFMVCSLLVVAFSSERVLLIPSWYPWDWTRSRIIYILTLSHQFFGIAMTAVLETANSTYPKAYLQVISAHSKTLRLRVLRLAQLQGNENQIYHELSLCIDDHTKILQSYKQIRIILSWHSLAQLSATTFIQCAIAISIIYTDAKEISKIIQMFLMACTMTSELFLLCNSCEMFRQECDELCKAIYDCNWIGQSIRFQKTIMIFLHQAQKFQEVMASNLFPVNYAIFLSILKISYSLFAVLNKYQQH